ncbi:phage tail spike protein [Paenibacillus senegalensis]|uniref:phage tail spike protein n=1 Tax=Paenibacillus senegalensis TaxID=1465766 RepID=UPI00028825F1|nr:phage tail spike protein [Paenibacillus senegalensis]
MRKSYVTIYDLQMHKVAYLENASNISYETPMNSLWTTSFDLPLDDPKTEHCRPFYFVEIWDGSERLDLFRILPQTSQRSAEISRVRYECEHVLATLLDDLMFQYHTVGNLGYHTDRVIQYVLNQQSTPRWKLGRVDFNYQYEYNWENTNLLGGLFSVPKPFVDEYMWTWDTTSYPWTLNLVRPSNQVQAYIRYGRNMEGITKDEDPTNLVNQIYALGYGEGINQLTFAGINGGKPYVEDIESQQKYGLKRTVFVDRRFEYEETLLARSQALLAELKDPRISYTVDTTELYNLTRDPIDKFRTGSLVRVQDPDIGDFTIRVVNVRKPDLRGEPGDVILEIANRPQDIAGTIADLSNRMKIEEVYAQGATNYDTQTFADNCDPNYPAIIRFRIPDETARINKVLLSYRSEGFRAYSRAIESAPAVTSGPSSRETTASGGGTTSGPSSRTTTASGGGTTSGPSSRTTTASGGGTTSGPSSATTSQPAGHANLQTVAGADLWVSGSSYPVGNAVQSDGFHTHGIDPGTWLMTANGNPVLFQYDSMHEHNLRNHVHLYSTIDHVHNMAHTHQISAHTHDMDHTHTIAAHTHNMDHTHTIAAHTHNMDHTHTIPGHTHGIEHGIFVGPSPTTLEIRVDNTVIPITATNGDEIDIIPFLSKDGGGKVRRGWHEIRIRPINSLGRIEASVFSQVFAQSRGGGDY